MNYSSYNSNVHSALVISDDAKFNTVAIHLGDNIVQEIGDTILSPPEQEKYQALKIQLELSPLGLKGDIRPHKTTFTRRK